MATAKKKPAAKKTAAKKAPAKKVVANKATVGVTTKIEKGLDKIRPGALIAEFLGAFLIAGAATVFANTGVEYLLIIVALVTVLGVISGAHFNPAITFAAWVNKKIKLDKAAFFVVAQVLGAVLAFFAIQGFVKEQNATYADDGTRTVATLESKLIEQGITQEQLDEAGGAEAWLENGGYELSQIASQLGLKVQYKVSVKEHKELAAFWAELVGSIIFGLGVAYALSDKKLCECGGVAKGFAYGGALLLALALVGSTAVLNPAAAFALGAYNFGSVWPWIIYLVAPFIGLTVGYSLYNLILKDVSEK